MRFQKGQKIFEKLLITKYFPENKNNLFVQLLKIKDSESSFLGTYSRISIQHGVNLFKTIANSSNGKKNNNSSFFKDFDPVDFDYTMSILTPLVKRSTGKRALIKLSKRYMKMQNR